MTEEYSRGSEWRKCDLHIHTPFSKETNYGNKEEKSTWDKFISDIEANYEIGSIIGICDYNTFRGYLKIKNDYPDFIKNYEVIPVVELRTDDYVGKTAEHKINLHIIFSNQIEDSELNRFLDYPLTRNNKKINDIENFNSEVVCIEKLKNFFKDNAIYYKNKYLFMLGRNEANEIDNDIKGSYMEDAQLICSASETIEQAQTSKENTNVYYNKYNIKYLHCSDAHSFSSKTDELTRKIGHCYTWIKGNPTFETIRQAFFSYDSRIRIQETKPLQAVNILENVEINLLDTTKIGNNDCCFAGKNSKLELNSALNCFIGGRGTGKSLLLQLMCKYNFLQLPKEDKNIVDKIKIDPNWKDYVKIDEIEFEYFGQGTIEKLYENKDEFQKTISDRLNKFWKSEGYKTDALDSEAKPYIEIINEKKQPLEAIIGIIESQIDLISSKIKNDIEIEKLIKEIVSRRKIIDAYQNKDYIKLSEEHEVISKRKEFFQSSKSSFISLIDGVKDIYRNFKKIDQDDKFKDIFYYAEKYNNMIDKLQEIINYDYSKEQRLIELENKINDDFNTSSNKVKQYFTEKGMSKSNVNDLVTAQAELFGLELKLKKLEVNNQVEEETFNTIKSDIENNNIAYCKIMEAVLKWTKTYLKTKENKEISNLTFEYKFDREKAFSDFAKFVKENIGIHENDFKSVLRKCQNLSENELVYSDKLEEICLTEVKSLKSCSKILDFFNSNKRNKQLYDLNCLLCINNSVKYEIFNTLYQGKNLDSLSFGQRATAIVLTLLLFGNKPLIIDEPETHLDQRFIANDLVNIIKQVKNDKQIIFATHNANIVINADAEQIYILKTEEDGRTSINQMTIEDVYDQSKKEELLLLEGSLEAFKKREEKYVI